VENHGGPEHVKSFRPFRLYLVPFVSYRLFIIVVIITYKKLSYRWQTGRRV